MIFRLHLHLDTTYFDEMMKWYNLPMSSYQDKQKKVIAALEKQIKANALTFSTVAPVTDYVNDPRICLTSVHFPQKSLIDQIQRQIIDPLQAIDPQHFYYPRDSLHLTIKNIRVINDPPHFTEEDVEKAQKIFSDVIPHHTRFSVYFYRLLLFPNNLALIGTTDPELDKLVLELDRKLTEAGIPDDKKYNNTQYFFSNMTLARFSDPSELFKKKVEEISQNLVFEPYIIDAVTLLTGNAVMKNRIELGRWSLT